MQFAYQAVDSAGQRVADVVDAANRDEAAEIVRAQGLFPLNVADRPNEEGAATPVTTSQFGLDALANPRRLAMFTQQMSMLLGAGAGVVPSLAAIERQVARGAWRGVIAAVRAEVEGGVSLAEALAKFPNRFDGVMRSMVAAGEASGTLAELFARLARMTRQQASIRNQLISASIYPLLLIVLAAGVVGGLMGFVLPRFAVLFSNLRVELPTSTAYLIAIGAWLGPNWPLVVLAIGAAGVGGFAAMRTRKGKEIRDYLTVSLPVLGNVIRRIVVARLLRVWGLLLESRIPLLEAMKLSRGITDNTVFQRLFDQLEEAVTEGKSMVPVLEDSKLITPAIVEGINTGESSGKMSVAILFLADQMDAENEQLIHALMRIVEPVILIVMGVVVGAVAISLFLPLFDIASAASGGCACCSPCCRNDGLRSRSIWVRPPCARCSFEAASRLRSCTRRPPSSTVRRPGTTKPRTFRTVSPSSAN